MTTDEKLSETFDVEPTPIEGEIVKPDAGILETNEKVDTDYDVSRENLHTLIENGKQALEHALSIAKQSEHPRAFEVVGNLIKQLADVNQQLMDIHQQKKKLDEPAKGTASGKVTNNNAIFVGSTAELSKLVDKMNKGE